MSISDTGMFSVKSICQYYGIAFDEAQIRHEFSIYDKKININDIQKISKKLGFKTRIYHKVSINLYKLPLPIIVGDKFGEFFLVAKIVDGNILVLKMQDGKPTIIKSDQFYEQWNGEAIVLKQKNYLEKDVKFGFRWFIPSIFKYKKPLIEVLISALAVQLLGLFSPIMTQVVIDKVLVHNSLTTLDVLAVGLLIIIFFELFIGVAKTFVFTNTTSKIDVILSTRLYKHLHNLPLRYFESRRVGDTIARVKELENIRRFLTGTPLTSLLDVVFIIVYILVMLFYSVKLTLIVLGSMPVFIIMSAIATPIFRSRLEDKFNAGAEAQSFLVESVSGINTIKSFALEPTMQKKWESIQAKYTNTSFRTSILSGNLGALGKFVQKIFDLLILWVGAHLAMEGSITIGQMIAFRMLAGRVSGPVLRLVQIWQDFQQTSISVDRIGDIFNTKTEPSMDHSKTRLPALSGNITFERVRFRYKIDSAEVIRDMSFNIPAGKIVGIVGRSGSGKSTIAKLIQRLYIPEAGKILIDGVDIALADPHWIRRQIGVVLQENFLFNMSIKDNIAIHNPGKSMEDIIYVSKIAGAHDFILELPNGYDTLVGEKGTGLSGGQKQRVAIARALLNNPRILIFDEATSALDYESESIIQKNLQKICEGRTVLIIAHRLSTLKDADMIMSVERGSVEEFDDQKILLSRDGLYSYLYNQQLGGNVE